MSKPFSLQILLDLSREKADEATRTLGALIAEEQGARERLQLLESYRAEYLEKFRAAQSSGLSPQAWQNFQSFLARLDEAVGQQLKIVTQANQKTTHSQHAWIEENRQVKALDTLAQRHQHKLQHAENRAEQKLLDEFSARRFHPSLPSKNPKEQS